MIPAFTTNADTPSLNLELVFIALSSPCIMAHEETSLNGSSTENEFAQRSDSDDETTPTSVRQSQVAALLERRTNGNTGPGNDERQFEGFTAAAGDVASVLLSPSLKVSKLGRKIKLILLPTKIVENQERTVSPELQIEKCWTTNSLYAG